jgi:hypothetical protein
LTPFGTFIGVVRNANEVIVRETPFAYETRRQAYEAAKWCRTRMLDVIEEDATEEVDHIAARRDHARDLRKHGEG